MREFSFIPCESDRNRVIQSSRGFLLYASPPPAKMRAEIRRKEKSPSRKEICASFYIQSNVVYAQGWLSGVAPEQRGLCLTYGPQSHVSVRPDGYRRKRKENTSNARARLNSHSRKNSRIQSFKDSRIQESFWVACFSR